MGDVNAVHLPEALIARVDVVAADELRTRSNLVRLLVSEGLARGESGAQDEDKVESR
jgi:metal-responsive CopG/Arc/MetJ family transcriptional regulator